MSLSNPRVLFGVHSIAPYNVSTGEPYGIGKVLGTAEVNLAGNLVELNGGSSKFAWSVQEGVISSDVNVTLREYPNFLFELMLGQAVTANAAEAAASATAIANKKGTSVVAATTGITSVASVTTAADVKFAYYVVKAVSATTVDVFAASDVDFFRGTDLVYQNDLLKITASALTITASSATVIPNTGISLNGGSGTIGMTTGDTAVFSSRPINTKSIDVTIGASGVVNPEFGMVILGEKLGSGEMVELDLFRCKGEGMPINLAAKAFSEAALKIKAFQDSSRNGVFSLRHVNPTSVV